MQLGGHPIYTRGEEVGFDTREPVEDVARIMAGYHAVIAARVFDHTTLTRMAAVVDVPIVNMLSDRSHPLQALADALTMQQRLGDLTGKTVAYVGDYNNVARSLAEISLMLGAHVRLACPVGFAADDGELERLALVATSATIEQSHRPIDAVDGRTRGAHRHLGVDGSGGGEGPNVDNSSRATWSTTTMMAAASPIRRLHALPARIPRRGGGGRGDRRATVGRVPAGPQPHARRPRRARLPDWGFVRDDQGATASDDLAPDRRPRGDEPAAADPAARRARHRGHAGDRVARSRRHRRGEGAGCRAATRCTRSPSSLPIGWLRSTNSAG